MAEDPSDLGRYGQGKKIDGVLRPCNVLENWPPNVVPNQLVVADVVSDLVQRVWTWADVRGAGGRSYSIGGRDV